MFERGVQDAEHDDLNPLYYQHYYYYRQGYDKARRRLRRTRVTSESSARQSKALLLIGVVVITLVAGGLFLRNRSGTAPLGAIGVASVASETVATSLASPTRLVRTPTPLPATPTPEPIVLHIQGAAIISNLNGNPLRVRAAAGTKARVVERLPEGTEVKIIEGPTLADGFTWWRVEAGKVNGWVAERAPEGTVWLQPKAE